MSINKNSKKSVKSNKIEIKPDLYNDLHPKKSLKNTGFKDEESAIRTIDLISKRAAKYQFDVINTMYNRAKYHPNKTDNMRIAMQIFKKWLEAYPKLKAVEDKYKILKLDVIEKYLNIANVYKLCDIMEVIKINNKKFPGFFKMYKKVCGLSYKLKYIPVEPEKPENFDYFSYRISFIKSKLEKMKKNNIPLYVDSGKYKGLPTKSHMNLILYAYSPDKNIYNN